MRYRFGPYTLDPAGRELLRRSEPVVLEPRTFSVLVHLVANRDRVVPKEELLDEVWGDHFVGESALTSQIKHARSAVGDDGQAQAMIRTVHRVGYRFVGEVDEEEAEPPARRDRTGPLWGAAETALLGRGRDLDALEGRLGDQPLVTIVGPPGVGKTSLATHLLERLAPAAPDGAWLCDLADTRDAAAVDNLVLAAVGEGQQSDADPRESLLRALEGRRAVVVLDGCEHVLEETGTLALHLVRRCRDLRVVATSRIPLGVEGEWIHALEPLDLGEATACFVAHAAQMGARVEPGDPALPELCRRLDCLPLALRLAAAHARVLAPAQMVGLLQDRFRLLRGATPGLADRHRSLDRTIAWSWDELPADDQALLARLTCFVGTFGLDDVRAVALPERDPLDVVDALGRLVHRSLVVPVPAASGETRFRLLESLREFAAARIDDGAGLRRRHAEHFAALAERLDEAFQTDRIDAAMTDMHAAWNNLRAAVRYAADAGDPHTVRRIVRAVGPFADVFQVYEVLEWCERAELSGALTDPAHAEVGADAVAVQARMLAHRGRHAEGRALAEAAHARCETHATLLSLVWCAYYAGDLDLVLRSADRLVELSRSDRGCDRGFADGFSAIVKAVRQEPAISSTSVSPADAGRGILGAQDCLTEGLRLCTTDPGRAGELLEAVVESAVRNDYRLLLGAAASTLTQVTLPARPPRDAIGTLRRTLERYLDRSMWVLISADTVMAAKLLADQGDVETASRLLGARNASGYAVGLSEVLRRILQEELEQRLGGRFAELAAQGATWRPPDAGRAAIAALDRVLDRLGPG